MKSIEELNATKIMPFLLAMTSFAVGDDLPIAESTPWGPWPFP